MLSILEEDLALSSDDDLELQSVNNKSLILANRNGVYKQHHDDHGSRQNSAVSVTQLDDLMASMHQNLQSKTERLHIEQVHQDFVEKITPLQEVKKIDVQNKLCDSMRLRITRKYKDSCNYSNEDMDIKTLEDDVPSHVSTEVDKMLQALPLKPGLIPNTIPAVPVIKKGTMEILTLKSYLPQVVTEEGNQLSDEKVPKGAKFDITESPDQADSVTNLQSSMKQLISDSNTILQPNAATYKFKHVNSVSMQNQSHESDDDFEIARFTPLVVNPSKLPSQKSHHSKCSKKYKQPLSTENDHDLGQVLRSMKKKPSRKRKTRKPKIEDRVSNKTCFITRLEPEFFGCLKNDQGIVMWICPHCNGQDDGSSMIRCDKCEYWFHFACAGINMDQPQETSWLCATCS